MKQIELSNLDIERDGIDDALNTTIRRLAWHKVTVEKPDNSQSKSILLNVDGHAEAGICV